MQYMAGSLMYANVCKWNAHVQGETNTEAGQEKNYDCLRIFEQVIAGINYAHELFKGVVTATRFGLD